MEILICSIVLCNLVTRVLLCVWYILNSITFQTEECGKFKTRQLVWLTHQQLVRHFKTYTSARNLR